MPAIASTTSVIRKWHNYVVVAAYSSQKLLDWSAHPSSLAMPHLQSRAGHSTGFHLTSSLPHMAVIHSLPWSDMSISLFRHFLMLGFRTEVLNTFKPLVSVHPPLFNLIWVFPKTDQLFCQGPLEIKHQDTGCFPVATRLQLSPQKEKKMLWLILTVCRLL